MFIFLLPECGFRVTWYFKLPPACLLHYSLEVWDKINIFSFDSLTCVLITEKRKVTIRKISTNKCVWCCNKLEHVVLRSLVIVCRGMEKNIRFSFKNPSIWEYSLMSQYGGCLEDQSAKKYIEIGFPTHHDSEWQKTVGNWARSTSNYRTNSFGVENFKTR